MQRFDVFGDDDGFELGERVLQYRICLDLLGYFRELIFEPLLCPLGYPCGSKELVEGEQGKKNTRQYEEKAGLGREVTR